MSTPKSSVDPSGTLLDPPNPSSSFSTVLTAFSTVFVLAAIGMIVWSYSSLSPLERIVAPEGSLERLTSRSMEFEHALKGVDPIERQLFRLLSNNDNALENAIRAYQELARFSKDPHVNLYLAILEGEAGRQQVLVNKIEGWKSQPFPYPLFRQFIRVGYLVEPRPVSEVKTLQAYLAEEVPENWFYSRLAIQLAKKGRDAAFALLTQQHLDDRAAEVLRMSRLLVFIEVAVFLIGLSVITMFMRLGTSRQPQRLKLSRKTLPPQWTGQDGFAVLVRGGAITICLLILLSVMEIGSGTMVIASMMAMYGPILLFAYYGLLLPNNVAVMRAFGLRIVSGSYLRVLFIVFILLAAGLIGDWVINVGVGEMDGALHWTEWFDQTLVWGTTMEVAVTIIAYAAMAPLCEELIFRGVLFASLRQRFGWGTAALLSSLIFSLVHGYGLIGVLTVFWSGLLWAWAYEKTGSLWPGVVAHGINNLLVSLTLVMVYR